MRYALLIAAAALGPAALAQPALDAVADALGIDPTVVSVEVRAETRTTLDGADTVVPSRRTTRRRSVRWRTAWGGETRTVTATPRGVIAGEGEAEARLGPDAARAVRASQWLDPLALALRRADLAASDLGGGLLRVRAPGLPDPILVKLDDAGRPVRLTTFVERGPARVYAEVVLSDYRETDGVWVPHRVVASEGGALRGTTTVGRVTVERGGN